jgi:transcriptional regulator NrdR family protein
MICPKCGSDKAGVTDTVKNPDANEIYRKRKCRDCGKAFHTIEFEVDYDDQFVEGWQKYYRGNGRTYQRFKQKKGETKK